MSFSRMLTAAAAVLLMGGIAFAAPAPKQTNHLNSNSSVMKSKMHHESGTIQSITDTDLTISHTYKGKTENLAFKIDTSTKKVGNVDTGARVEVYYKNENGDHVATEIKALKSKMGKM